MKYNYSLEKECQAWGSYPAFIEVGKNCKDILITVRKPVDNTNYVTEADQNIIRQKKQQAKIDLL